MRYLFIAVPLFLMISACGKGHKTEVSRQSDTGAVSHTDNVATSGSSKVDIGKLKYAGICLGCHGRDGRGQGPFPKLAGRPAAELQAMLKEYRAGKVRGPASETMKPFAEPLTDTEIDVLAAYLSTQ